MKVTLTAVALAYQASTKKELLVLTAAFVVLEAIAQPVQKLLQRSVQAAKVDTI